MERSPLAVPIAIVIAAGLIAGAIYLTNRDTGPVTAQNTGTNRNGVEIEPVTDEDHIRGNPNAPILMVEYSDYDCPFCKTFHETMKRVMSEYGTDGDVAWVYRHFPIPSLHPNAPRIAEASECVAELAGNDAFWTFSDLVFGERAINELTDMSRIPEYAEAAGASRDAFDLCYNSQKYQDIISQDIAEAQAAGAQGTPYTVLVVGDQTGVISGAQPYETVRQIIDSLLAQIERTEG